MSRKRRYWSVEEKRTICLQASAPGVSVARVARQYSVNANQIFNWLRDPRFAPPANQTSPFADDAVFLPVEVASEVPVAGVPAPVPEPVSTLRIELSGGHRVFAEGGYDPERLGRLLKAWVS